MKIKFIIPAVIACVMVFSLPATAQITIWDRVPELTTVGQEARDSLTQANYTVDYITELAPDISPTVLITFMGMRESNQGDYLSPEEVSQVERLLTTGNNLLFFGYYWLQPLGTELGFDGYTVLPYPADSAWGTDYNFLQGMVFSLDHDSTYAFGCPPPTLPGREIIEVNHNVIGYRGVWYINDYGTKIVTVNITLEKILREPGFNTREELYLRILQNFFGVYPQAGVPENETSPVPSKALLYRCYPNPFNAQTTIDFLLPEDSPVALEIFDILGHKIETLIDNEKLRSGRHQVIWNGNKQASGVYFYRITTGKGTGLEKMVLLK